MSRVALLTLRLFHAEEVSKLIQYSHSGSVSIALGFEGLVDQVFRVQVLW